MIRMFLVMVTTALLGIGSGYFLWGSRVARLTESLSTLTLEQDTMRARLAAPATAGGPAQDGSEGSPDQLRVLNESIAAVRQELAEQRATMERMERNAAVEASIPPNAAAAAAEIRNIRNELAGCIADKQDLELRLSGAVPPPDYAPPPLPDYRPAVPDVAPQAAPAPPATAPAPAGEPVDPRF